MLHRRLGAGVETIRRRNSAVIGEHLHLGAVVQLQQLGHEIADRVLAQVGGHIADPQAPAGKLDGRMTAIAVRRAGPLLHRLFHIAGRRRQLQQRVIGIGGHGQGVGIGDQGLAIDPIQRGRRRPFALDQPDGHQLFQHVALVRVEGQALLERHLRGVMLMAIASHPRQLLQGGDLVVDRGAGHRRQPGDPFGPDTDRPLGALGALQKATEIDVGRHEVRAAGDAVLQRDDGARRVAHLVLQAAAVEQGHIELGVVGIEPDPDLVELLGQVPLPGLDQARRGGDQIGERRGARRNLLEGGVEGLIGHADPARGWVEFRSVTRRLGPGSKPASRATRRRKASHGDRGEPS